MHAVVGVNELKWIVSLRTRALFFVIVCHAYFQILAGEKVEVTAKGIDVEHITPHGSDDLQWKSRVRFTGRSESDIEFE
jgi:hypothetical protein